MIFCFVILHYKNLEETIKCVSSIKDNYLNYNIVIVDNASNDGTGEILCQMYKDYSTINVLIQKEAKGFSYGNNLGIEFAKQNFDPDFLIICNNDVQFVDQDLYLKICQIYKETNFSVMGPDVYYVKMSEHQSPFRNEWMREKETLEEIAYYQKRLKNRLRFDFFFRIIYKCEWIINNHNISKNIVTNITYIYKRHIVNRQHKSMKCDKRQYNVCLYGACLVISKKFFYEYDKVFYPETMFYAEEDILLTKCIMKNLVVLYEPSIRVTHSNKASTFINDKDKYERTIWRLKQLIESRKVYLELLKELDIK